MIMLMKWRLFGETNTPGEKTDQESEFEKKREEGYFQEKDKPVTLEVFEKFVEVLSGSIEKRFEIFAKKAGLNPSVAKDTTNFDEDGHPKVEKPEYLDPVKPSTVENLPERKKATSFQFDHPAPPSRVEKMRAREAEYQRTLNVEKGSARPNSLYYAFESQE